MMSTDGLNAEQAIAVEAICDPHFRCVHVDGGAGSGKSFLLHEAVKRLKASKIEVLVAAPTGISAENVKGVTMHSLLRCGYAGESFYSDVKPKKNKRLAQLSIVIIDEISMVSAEMLDLFDRIARTARDKQGLPFGGIKVVFVGDFYQLPPVNVEGLKPKCPNEQHSRDFAFNSLVWRELESNGTMKSCCLSQSLRHAGDDYFMTALNKIRNATLQAEDFTELKEKLQQPPAVPLPDGVLVSYLYPKVKEVNKYNTQEQSKLEGDERQYYNFAWQRDRPQNEPSMIRYAPTREHDSDLQLKVGSQVMVTTNMIMVDGKPFLVNGSRGVVVKFISLNDAQTWVESQKATLGDDDVRTMDRLAFQSELLKDIVDRQNEAVAVETEIARATTTTTTTTSSSSSSPVRSPGAASNQEQEQRQGQGQRCFIQGMYCVKRQGQRQEAECVNNHHHQQQQQQQMWPVVRFKDDMEMPILPIKNKDVSYYKNFPFEQVRTYEVTVPLVLAWAITIHKSQGLTLDHLRVDLKETFSDGQVYTAISRARSIDTIQVDNFSLDRIHCNEEVKKFYTRTRNRNRTELNQGSSASAAASAASAASSSSSSPSSSEAYPVWIDKIHMLEKTWASLCLPSENGALCSICKKDSLACEIWANDGVASIFSKLRHSFKNNERWHELQTMLDDAGIDQSILMDMFIESDNVNGAVSSLREQVQGINFGEARKIFNAVERLVPIAHPSKPIFPRPSTSVAVDAVDVDVVAVVPLISPGNTPDSPKKRRRLTGSSAGDCYGYGYGAGAGSGGGGGGGRINNDGDINISNSSNSGAVEQVYVLRLQNGKYYVGMTNNPQNRLQQHRERGDMCAEWTKVHHVIESIPLSTQLRLFLDNEDDCIADSHATGVRGSNINNNGNGSNSKLDIPAIERQETLRQIDLHGVNNVRGGPWTTMELSTVQREEIRKGLCDMRQECYKCGLEGHFSKDCISCH